MLIFDKQTFSDHVKQKWDVPEKGRYRIAKMQTGISECALWKIINEQAEPQMHTFLKLCSWLGTEPSIYFITHKI